MRIFFLEWNAEYGKLMINNLAADYDIHEISRLLYRFKSLNKKIPGNILKKIHLKMHYRVKLGCIKSDDIIICNAYSALAIVELIELIPCKKILLCRDTLEKLNNNMRNKRLLQPNENYLEKVKPYFDKIYSFEENDCHSFGINFLHQFLSFTSAQYLKQNHQVRSIANMALYVGEFTEYRADILIKIHAILKALNYITDFHLVSTINSITPPYFCKNEKISYCENIKKVQTAKILIEINRHGQTGLTLRALEALFFNKKLITNNKEIKNHIFYCPERIFIWGTDSVENIGSFLAKDIEPVDLGIIKNYTADAMIDRLIKDIRN
ncbi:hypothetical protein MUA02_15120 [Enterobacteriaceae bacterium H20N1]|uniref:Uncharacterized protein n=1 Tax=Dryocola boscaweniae TaxID=2925397 RepID=A0A9X2W975_9ENTR|nr:hypothetical protein [Dryocola boscaweniae]MCT4703185.1 hypothetical protein [Dryocola boscaweniae]MCT4720353.1 hypothetical protein [Dryocola boscaweniae]